MYRGRWHSFFYASAIQPVVAGLAILLAMVVRPGEWVLSPLLVNKAKAEVYKDSSETEQCASPNSPLL